MISHAMPHVLELADHVTVMRHGAVVAEMERGDLRSEDIIRHIVGGSVPL
jgi:ABC-type sugar transport system ATPase subunit